MNMIKSVRAYIKNNLLLLLIAVFSFVSMVNAIDANKNSQRAYDYAGDASDYARYAAGYSELAANNASDAARYAADAVNYASEAADAARQASLNAMLY